MIRLTEEASKEMEGWTPEQTTTFFQQLAKKGARLGEVLLKTHSVALESGQRLKMGEGSAVKEIRVSDQGKAEVVRSPLVKQAAKNVLRKAERVTARLTWAGAALVGLVQLGAQHYAQHSDEGRTSQAARYLLEREHEAIRAGGQAVNALIDIAQGQQAPPGERVVPKHEPASGQHGASEAHRERTRSERHSQTRVSSPEKPPTPAK